jgi:hypothetical protein
VAAPTSFEGPFGKIVYRVRAIIDTPRFSKDYKAQRPFYLLNLLNLNQVPNIEVKTSQHCLNNIIKLFCNAVISMELPKKITRYSTWLETVYWNSR